MTTGTLMLRRAGLLLCAVLVAGVLRPTSHRAPSPSVGARLDAAIQPLVKRGQFTGVVVVTRDGQTLMSKGYGLADHTHHVPNTPHTPYPYESITKAFTALAILQLQAQGKLHMSDPACHYLPSCPASWRRITIQDLLSHTAGLPYGNPSDPTDTAGVPRPLTVAGLVAHWQTLPLYPLGTFNYSNAGYTVLADIIQRLSGQPYMTYLRGHILQPLGLTGIGDVQAYRTLPRHAQGYVSGIPGIPLTAFDAAAMIGAATLDGSATDLARWDNALLAETGMTRTFTTQMWTPHVQIAPHELVYYGDGWYIEHRQGHRLVVHGRRTVYHSGHWYGGFYNLNILYPDDHVAVIVLSNQHVAPNAVWQAVDRVLFPT